MDSRDTTTTNGPATIQGAYGAGCTSSVSDQDLAGSAPTASAPVAAGDVLGRAGHDADTHDPPHVRTAAARAATALRDREGFERWLRDRVPERGFPAHWSEHPGVDVLARYLHRAAGWAFEVDARTMRVRTVGLPEWNPLPGWTAAWLRAAYGRREVVRGDGPAQARVTRAAALEALADAVPDGRPARHPPGPE